MRSLSEGDMFQVPREPEEILAEAILPRVRKGGAGVSELPNLIWVEKSPMWTMGTAFGAWSAENFHGSTAYVPAFELKQAQDKLAEYGDEIARLRGEIADTAEHAERLLRIATEFKDFHDDHKNKPCGDYDRECPISMGEWFDAADRQAITMAIKALKNDH